MYIRGSDNILETLEEAAPEGESVTDVILALCNLWTTRCVPHYKLIMGMQ